MEEPTENGTIVEEREELMISLFADGKPYLRRAHFLKPTSSSIDEPIPKLSSLSPSFLPDNFEPEAWPLKACFSGWRKPIKKWVSWVEILRQKYQTIWEKAGIFEAIMSSTSTIKRYDDLIIGLAEKWNPETNTFFFPWGETTISLEDVMILGGYSVTGFPVTFPAGSEQFRGVETKLVEEFGKMQGGMGKRVTQTKWIENFMGSGRDIEHEAFLSLWLAMFVFPNFDRTIKKRVFPIAGHLGRGEVMALGPAVLASIYKDLTLLRETIVGSTKFKGEADDCVLEIRLCSPMQLVQLWAWERFPALQPKPNPIHNFDPRSARWSSVNIVKVENVRMVLDSARETFDWRPYAKVVNNCKFHEFYKEKEEWISSVTGILIRELMSFALCLRPSELVGLGSDLGCIQQYLPHRVAMQFGIDQDIPCHVARSNDTPEIAWKNYLRPIKHKRLYIPSRFFESDITIQYLDWWNKLSMVVQLQPKVIIKGMLQRNRSKRKRPKRIPWVKPRKGENNASVPPGFPPKLNKPLVDEVKSEPFDVEVGVKSESFDVVVEVIPEYILQVSNEKATVVTTGTGPLSVDIYCVDMAQGISPSVADNIGAGLAKTELSATPTQKAVEINAQNGGGSSRVVGDADKGEFEFPIHDKENTIISSTMELYLRLEARVTRIEKLVSQLKAAK